ncbi:PREDICTED: neuronal acetylcholine receptor subunit alpha-6-like [Branchiostoma belcheri]|uniref:Neuronal acetylcholine receptor subunit alpha-6-like n=1 Tax=Branchiostoma belcheri TaxID=7741 RepID=A0A6P4YLQ4_BRABE|nr:PREDICTED: neuronal acetylcholine receptor subunit alpha-6-like [Branchiostoma belcheri]
MQASWRPCLVLLTSALVAMFRGSSGNVTEKDLLDRLVTGYRTDARPVKKSSAPVRVTINVALAQLLDVNDRDQQIEGIMWMRLYWTDEYLVWDPDDYCGLEAVRMQGGSIWRPDIVLYNGIVQKGFAELPDTKVTITANGSVTYLYPFTFKASCKINVIDFPYDTQKCPFKFGSWTYDAHAIDVTNMYSEGDLYQYKKNGEWDVIKFVAKRNEVKYSPSDVPYVDVTYTLAIERQPLFYIYHIFAPCIVILLISLLSFSIPPDSGEKLSLSITMLLSLIVYMHMVIVSLPATSNYIPLIGTFFGIIILVVAMSTILSILTIALNFTYTTTKPPYWLKQLLGLTEKSCWLDCLFCGCVRLAKQYQLDRYSEREIHQRAEYYCNTSAEEFAMLPSQMNIEDNSGNGKQGHFREQLENSEELLPKLDGVVNKLEAWKQDQLKHTKKEAVSNEWKTVASRLDRVFLLIFLAACVIVSCTMTYVT